jgi:hypothetical protein
MVWSESLGRLIKKSSTKSSHSVHPPEAVTTWEEKRRDRRVELEVLMTATTREGDTYRAYSRDLSHAGSAAIIWGELKVGDRLSLAYRFPHSEEEIVVPAVVRHAIEHRYGMEFVGRDREHLETEIAKVFRAAEAVIHPNGAN